MISRLPLTLALLLLIITLGVFANAYASELDAEVHRQVGYSTRLLLEGEVHRIFASLLFTAGGLRFYQSVIMLGLIVGWTEWRHGTWRAAWIFFGVHVATVVIMSLLIAWPLAKLGIEHGRILFSERDVGPSAGYYGCLGYSLGSAIGWKWRSVVIALSGAVLAARLVWSAMHLEQSSGGVFSADLAHALAFPIGLLAWQYWSSKRLNCESNDDES